MTHPGRHQRLVKVSKGDQFSRVSCSFTAEQIAELNALAVESNRSFSATVAYLVEHALRGRRKTQSSKGD